MSFALPVDHPCLPGHFPGRALVPGVVLLDAVFQAIAAAGHGGVVKLRHAKFIAPVGPGEAVEIVLATPAPGRIGFRCLLDDVLVLSGEAELA